MIYIQSQQNYSNQFGQIKNGSDSKSCTSIIMKNAKQYKDKICDFNKNM